MGVVVNKVDTLVGAQMLESSACAAEGFKALYAILKLGARIDCTRNRRKRIEYIVSAGNAKCYSAECFALINNVEAVASTRNLLDILGMIVVIPAEAEGNERLGRILSMIVLLRSGYSFFSEVSLSA